ncbi:MAG: hypothetical protein ACP5LF_04100 [Nitrososphaeria archaeon]|nr:hypothetical protein [Conexivisphaerales archaeon]
MPLFKKEVTLENVKDIQALVDKFASYLEDEGYKVQKKVEGDRAIIQAQKGGILRDIVAAERALTFTFEKNGNDVKATVGVGKWLQNLGVTALEVLFLSEIFLFVDVPEILWNSHVENELIKKLKEIAKEA